MLDGVPEDAEGRRLEPGAVEARHHQRTVAEKGRPEGQQDRPRQVLPGRVEPPGFTGGGRSPRRLPCLPTSFTNRAAEWVARDRARIRMAVSTLAATRIRLSRAKSTVFQTGSRTTSVRESPPARRTPGHVAHRKAFETCRRRSIRCRRRLVASCHGSDAGHLGHLAASDAPASSPPVPMLDLWARLRAFKAAGGSATVDRAVVPSRLHQARHRRQDLRAAEPATPALDEVHDAVDRHDVGTSGTVRGSVRRRPARRPRPPRPTRRYRPQGGVGGPAPRRPAPAATRVRPAFRCSRAVLVSGRTSPRQAFVSSANTPVGPMTTWSTSRAPSRRHAGPSTRTAARPGRPRPPPHRGSRFGGARDRGRGPSPPGVSRTNRSPSARKIAGHHHTPIRARTAAAATVAEKTAIRRRSCDLRNSAGSRHVCLIGRSGSPVKARARLRLQTRHRNDRPARPQQHANRRYSRPFAVKNPLATVATSCPSITTRPTSSVISSVESRALTASSNAPNLVVQHLRTDHGRDVLRVLEAPVVHEWDEPVLFDARVRGEQQPDLHRVAPERVDGQRPSRVQRREVVEEDPIDLVQSREAERPLGAFRRPAERQLAGDGGEGAHRGQVEPLGRLRVRHELIRVLGRRRCEQREPSGPEQLGGLSGNIGGICGRVRVRVEEQQ